MPKMSATPARSTVNPKTIGWLVIARHRNYANEFPLYTVLTDDPVAAMRTVLHMGFCFGHPDNGEWTLRCTRVVVMEK
jgi:hypothetical protein